MIVSDEIENKQIAKQYKELLQISYQTLSGEDKKLIRSAFDTAVHAHRNQRRKTGEPYIHHPINVAKIVAHEIGLDATSIASALLHDVLEDTDFKTVELEKLFGKGVAKIVEGLTKISKLSKESDISLQAENFKKLLLTLNDDVRVIIIKIADRLHNMQTLDAMPEEKQLKISSETLYIYAPLAHRIGLYNIKTELEDLSFKYTDPIRFKSIKNKIEESKEEQSSYIKSFSKIIKNDLQIFGVGVLIFLVITLSFIFRQLRWVILPVLTCSFSVIATTGLLGMFGWEVTVISSNFISLQLIITMAITIHLIVRYRELARTQPDKNQHDLVLDTVVFMAMPCLYAVLTTIAGFSSLILSGILPVINFGWMMSAGVSVSLLMTFLLFPALQLQFNKLMPNLSFENRFSLTLVFSRFTDRYGNGILWFSALLLIISMIGGTRLMVENSFIDYFKESTEIYQGLKVIDQKLGGTTTLDVVLNFEDDEEPEDVSEEQANPDTDEEESEEFEDFSEFEEEIEAEEGGAQYWFTSYRMEQLEALHN